MTNLYNFTFTDYRNDDYPFTLNFKGSNDTLPKSNIHVLVGNNGCGKTSLLENMQYNLIYDIHLNGVFEDDRGYVINSNNSYFSNLITISFSIFNNFSTRKHYKSDRKHYNIGDDIYSHDRFGLKYLISYHFSITLNELLKTPEKTKVWLCVYEILKKEQYFSDIDLPTSLKEFSMGKVCDIRTELSCGHYIVLLTLSKLILRIEDRSMVLIDEPEVNLSPYLMGFFTSALSYIFENYNAMCIIASNSSIMLQEVSNDCVHNIVRHGEITKVYNPEIDTFGGIPGSIERDIFNMGSIEFGYNRTLKENINKNDTIETITDKFGNNLGLAARAFVHSIIDSFKN